ncbi:MAG: hypothetical protein GF393_00965, partial [Armatimonadia bacterium]|nr:hypothetical protein [Armatimonadia bacterium]
MRNNRRVNKRNNGKSEPQRFSSLYYTRAAMAAGTAVLLFVAISARLVPEKVSLKAGEVASRTIIAPRSVTYTDTQATQE